MMKTPYLRKALCQAEQGTLQSTAVLYKQQEVFTKSSIPLTTHLAIDIADLVLSSLQ